MALFIDKPSEAKISIHALREESDGTIIMDSPNLQNISIHALREESDAGILSRTSATIKFQSTLSVRRATQLRRQVSMTVAISIHALREESDMDVFRDIFNWLDFNPRSP